MLMRLSATLYISILHVKVSITKRISTMILRMIIAGKTYIRIPKSKRNAEMQIKNLDFINTVFFIDLIKPLAYTA
jgi:hypothetical protein